MVLTANEMFIQSYQPCECDGNAYLQGRGSICTTFDAGKRRDEFNVDSDNVTRQEMANEYVVLRFEKDWY